MGPRFADATGARSRPSPEPAGLGALSGCVSGVLGGVPSDLVGPLAGDLSGGHVRAVVRVDRRDRDHERGELLLGVVARGLIPDLVGYRVGTVGETGAGLCER